MSLDINNICKNIAYFTDIFVYIYIINIDCDNVNIKAFIYQLFLIYNHSLRCVTSTGFGQTSLTWDLSSRLVTSDMRFELKTGHIWHETWAQDWSHLTWDLSSRLVTSDMKFELKTGHIWHEIWTQVWSHSNSAA